MLDLVPGAVYAGILGEWILQFKDGQRQAVDEEDDVGTAVVASVNRELVGDEEFVPFRVLPIDGIDQPVGDVPGDQFEGQFVSTHQPLVESHVAAQGIDAVGTNEVEDGQFDGGIRQVGILTGEELTQTQSEDHFVGRPVEFDSRRVAVTKLFQAGDGREFKFGLGPPPVRHGYPRVAPSRGPAVRRTSALGAAYHAGWRACATPGDCHRYDEIGDL